MKALKITIGILFAAVIIALSMTLFVKNELADMLNPFIPHKDVFVKIDQVGKKLDQSTYEYSLEGINEDGKKIKITFTASKQLREGAYLNFVDLETEPGSTLIVDCQKIAAIRIEAD